ncbi:MAG: ABC transporter permease subunit [Nitrososphaeria archaeon]|nr:ABC transporter permease subunit [Nitrososphaeria archaeon]NIN51561.1 ABC transporter permease subunit [Nitrososphaeria archaeon]NIQ32052.1 ABC transporter permease subunit [Nitrososphaeria archaeon]
MPGLTTVFRKELTDHFSSRRFIILFLLVFLAGLSTTYVAAQYISQELTRAVGSKFVFLRLFTASGGVTPPFLFFVSFFGPIIGVAFGFDAINREQNSGTLSRVLSQPLHRDAVINGKFLAGVVTVGVMMGSIILIVSGLGLRLIGIPPNIDEGLRLVVFLFTSIIYVALWMSLGILFSILFRRVTTSALASIAVWMFLSFFIYMIAGVVASFIVPLQQPYELNEPELILRYSEVQQMVMRISPTTLFQEVTVTILTPTVRSIGPVLTQDISRLLPTPLPVDQSLIIVWPHLTGLVILTLICFALSYTVFIKQEIRAGGA